MSQELLARLRHLNNRVELARDRLRQMGPSRDILADLQQCLGDREWILFCGAGISVPGSSGAPAFLDLRNGLVLALAKLLLSEATSEAVGQALMDLPRRSDLQFPPELIFSFLRQAVGDSLLVQLLACLNQGSPNENHQAIARLVASPASRLRGVITPNFDTYIEQALGNSAMQLWVRGRPSVGSGFPIVKPHGSLKDPASIAVAFEHVLVRLEDSMTDGLCRMLRGRTLLILGYSGWDYDLFPLLVHAGRDPELDCRIVWLLWDHASLNEQVARMQLALGDRCTILNANRTNVLSRWAGLPQPGAPLKHDPLPDAFAALLARAAPHRLLAAFQGVVAPIDLPGHSELEQQLLNRMFRSVEADPEVSVQEKLGCLLRVASGTEDNDLREQAIHRGEQTATSAGLTDWAMQFQRLARSGPVTGTAEERRAELELQLHEGFYPKLRDLPDPERARKSLYTNAQVMLAETLLELEAFEEADRLARKVLQETSFPTSGVSREAWMTEDGKTEGLLYHVVAQAALARGATVEAAAALVRCLEIFWREVDGMQLEQVLFSVRQLACLVEDDDLERTAADLLDQLPQLWRDG